MLRIGTLCSFRHYLSCFSLTTGVEERGNRRGTRFVFRFIHYQQTALFLRCVLSSTNFEGPNKCPTPSLNYASGLCHPVPPCARHFDSSFRLERALHAVVCHSLSLSLSRSLVFRLFLLLFCSFFSSLI